MNSSPTAPETTLAHTATSIMQCEEAQLPKQTPQEDDIAIKVAN